MRIGIDARFFGAKGKGLGRYTQRLIENLEKTDSQNEYVIFLRKENWNLYQPGSGNFKKALADYRWYSVAEQIFLPLKIYQNNVDLMHFPHFNVPIFYFGRFLVTIHDLILRHFPTRRASTLGPIKYWLKNFGYKIVIQLAVWRAQKIITVSHYVKNDVIRCFGVRPEKIVFTYEGAPQKISNFQFPISNLNKYGINKPYLLYVGNAYPHKNLEKLIESFAILISKNNDLELVLVGEIDYFYQRLKKYIRGKFPHFVNKVIFTDFVSDEELAIIYNNAAAYIFPSLCEGFGLPPLEAMSYGVPVISSRSTCLPEVLGGAACYFDATNTQDMAEKINKILTDKSLAEKMIIAGYEQIKKYSWQIMAEETLKIYLA